MFIEPLQTLIHETISLITILNPIAAAAIVISSSDDSLTQTAAKQVAYKASIVVFIASCSTVFLGNFLFDMFGISTSSIMVIGGIILLLMSLHMLQGKISALNHTSEESEDAQQKDNIALIPIGIPVLFGPGVISTLMIFKANGHTVIDSFILVCAVAISLLATYIILRNAVYLVKLLGVSGLKIMTRIMGLIVGATAVQFIVFGIHELIGK